MADFDDLLGSAAPGRIGEYSEMLKLTCQSPGPPHQILTFCYIRLGGETPRSLMEDFATTGREKSLNDMAETFEERYHGPRSSSEWLDLREIRKLMEALWNRLEQSLRVATSGDPNWQMDHQDLLEFHGSRPCGQTLFTDYDSGAMSSRIAAWNKKATQAIAKRGAANAGDRLKALCEASLQPFEIIYYLQRTVFETRYLEMVDNASTPLRRIAEDLEAHYPECGVERTLLSDHFECLHRALGRAVSEVPRPEQVYRNYEALRGRTIGDTELKDYEISRLTIDIPNWTNSIRKSLQNRYYGGAGPRQAGAGV